MTLTPRAVRRRGLLRRRARRTVGDFVPEGWGADIWAAEEMEGGGLVLGTMVKKDAARGAARTLRTGSRG